MTRLAPVYGFDEIPALVARKASGRERGALADAASYDADLDRVERMLQEALAESPLPPEAPNADELNEFLIRMRKEQFA